MFIAAVAIVDSLTRPTRFLAAQRAYPPQLAGQWELPGGKVEDGEDPTHAAIREIKEELGVELNLGPIVTDDGRDWEIPVGTMRVWLATTQGNPTPREHMAVTWVDRDTVMDLDWLVGDIPLARHLATDILVGVS